MERDRVVNLVVLGRDRAEKWPLLERESDLGKGSGRQLGDLGKDQVGKWPKPEREKDPGKDQVGKWPKPEREQDPRGATHKPGEA